MKNSKNLLHYLTNRLRVLHTHTYATEHMFCTVSTLQLYFFLDVLLYYPHVYYTGEGTSERAGACLFLQNQVQLYCNYNYREYPYLYKALCFTFTGNIYMPTCVRFLLQSWSTLHPFHCLWSILPPMLVVLWNFYPHDPTQRIDPSPLILSMYTIYLRRPLLR